jgi:hypothetical protein
MAYMASALNNHGGMLAAGGWRNQMKAARNMAACSRRRMATTRNASSHAISRIAS